MHTDISLMGLWKPQEFPVVEAGICKGAVNRLWLKESGNLKGKGSRGNGREAPSPVWTLYFSPVTSTVGNKCTDIHRRFDSRYLVYVSNVGGTGFCWRQDEAREVGSLWGDHIDLARYRLKILPPEVAETSGFVVSPHRRCVSHMYTPELYVRDTRVSDSTVFPSVRPRRKVWGSRWESSPALSRKLQAAAVAWPPWPRFLASKRFSLFLCCGSISDFHPNKS